MDTKPRGSKDYCESLYQSFSQDRASARSPKAPLQEIVILVFSPNWAVKPSQKNGYKPALQSNLHFMVTALYHFPINTSWLLIDFILYPLPEVRILCLLGQHKEGRPILIAVFNAAANHGD